MANSDAEDSESSSEMGSVELAPSFSSEEDISEVTVNKQVPVPISSKGKVVTAKQLQLLTVPPGLGKKRANSGISSCYPPKTKSTPPKGMQNIYAHLYVKHVRQNLSILSFKLYVMWKIQNLE